MSVFADTNWLEALYFVPDENDRKALARTATAERRMRRIGGTITISQIVLLEARNVFGRLSKEGRSREWDNLTADLQGTVRVDVLNWPELRERTMRILERFSHKAKLGTFDASLVASAQLAQATELLSFDEQVKVLATCLGLRVFPELSAEAKTRVTALRAA